MIFSSWLCSDDGLVFVSKALNPRLMKRIKQILQALTEASSDYLQLKMRLITLQISEKVSKVLSDFFSLLILVIVFSFGLVLVSVGLAQWIGHLLDKEWIGFFIVGAFYFLLGIILILTKEKMVRMPLLNAIVKGLFKVEKKAEYKVETVEEKIVDKLD